MPDRNENGRFAEGNKLGKGRPRGPSRPEAIQDYYNTLDPEEGKTRLQVLLDKLYAENKKGKNIDIALDSYFGKLTDKVDMNANVVNRDVVELEYIERGSGGEVNEGTSQSGEALPSETVGSTSEPEKV
jgi:hypothetical protein